MTARKTDGNGWYEIRSNPLSKVGVFPYSGSQIGGEPGKIYQVYRPEEELSNSETLDSFKLLPFIDDHVMLGSPEKGLTPAEQKGIEGVIGEEVYYKDGILYGNIKVFSENLADLIEGGKKQLSAGYRCIYEIVSGVWNGIQYDAIQRKIRGNHLALVMEGRMGPEVAVLDKFSFTFDTKEIEEMTKPTQDERLAKVLDWAEARIAQDEAEAAKKKEEEKAIKDGMKGIKGVDEEEEEKEKGKKAEDEGKEDEEKEKGMDAAAFDAAVNVKLEEFKKNTLRELSARDALAKKLSTFIGAFDHAEKTLDEVAKYGIEKLGITCPAGSEKAVLDGFFHNRSNTQEKAFALDAAHKKTSGLLAAKINKNRR